MYDLTLAWQVYVLLNKIPSRQGFIYLFFYLTKSPSRVHTYDPPASAFLKLESQMFFIMCIFSKQFILLQ